MKKLLLLCLVSLVIIAFEVSASSYKTETSSDKLEIGETFANVIPVLTSKEIPELQSGTIKTKGTTKYNQYLRFSGLPYPYAGLAKNSKNEVEDFLIVTRNTGSTNAFFEYELEFESGLESDISSSSLKDLIGQQLYIFDQAYTITLATTTGNTVEIQMLSGGASDTIEKGQAKQITLDSRTYNIKVLSVEQSTGKVMLEIDGLPISSMIKGEVQDLGSGNYIGITKILFSSGGSSNDIVEVFIGAQIIEFKDKNYVDGNFEEEVKINTHKQTSAYVNIIASLSGTTLKISKIKYRVASILGQKVKKGTFLSDYLGDQVDSLLGNWDILYQGLKTVPTNAVLFAPSGSDDEYKISFKNNNGNTFTNIPFLSSKGTFKLGDSSNDLVIQENTAIDINDYFILTSRNDKTGNTYVLRYNSIDATQQSLKIFDYSSSSEKTVSYQNSTTAGLIGTFELNIGTVKTNGTISSASGNALTVDLNTDGIAGSNVVYIVTEGGGVLVTEALAGTTYTMNLRTESSQFEENSTDENIQFVFESRSGNKIGIQSTFTGITTTTKDTDILGLSNFGVSMKYTDQGGTEAENLLFDYPQSQRFAEASIEVYQSPPTQQITASTTQSSCSNGILDGDETAVDCGGLCSPCGTPESAAQEETCLDGIKNQDETGIDCGGSCLPCQSQEEQCPNGCVYVGADNLEICMSIGETTETLFCGKNSQLKLKKPNSLPCAADYECKIGICENNKCGKEMKPLVIGLNIAAMLLFLGSLFYTAKILIRRA